MYRLMVKNGRKWLTGRNEYDSYLAAQTRQLEMELVGIKTKIVPAF